MRKTATRLWSSDPAYRDVHSRAQMGRRHSEETKKKMREMRAGRLCPWKEGPCPIEVRNKIGETLKGKYKDPAFKERVIKAHLERMLPTAYEKKIISLCEKNRLPFEFVGDGKLMIEGKCPDFSFMKKGYLIEVYHGHWKAQNYETERAKLFKRHGYRVLFLDDNDLDKKNWEEICLKKIKEFLGE